MRRIIYYFSFLCCCLLWQSTANAGLNPDMTKTNSEEDFVTCNPARLAYWNLNACESFANNGTNNDFSEFNGNTSTPAGFAVVNASIII